MRLQLQRNVVETVQIKFARVVTVPDTVTWKLEIAWLDNQAPLYITYTSVDEAVNDLKKLLV